MRSLWREKYQAQIIPDSQPQLSNRRMIGKFINDFAVSRQIPIENLVELRFTVTDVKDLIHYQPRSGGALRVVPGRIEMRPDPAESRQCDKQRSQPMPRGDRLLIRLVGGMLHGTLPDVSGGGIRTISRLYPLRGGVGSGRRKKTPPFQKERRSMNWHQRRRGGLIFDNRDWRTVSCRQDSSEPKKRPRGSNDSMGQSVPDSSSSEQCPNSIQRGFPLILKGGR